MTQLKKIFLSWKNNLPLSAAEKLMEHADPENSFIDLSNILVVVYGREAIRKLLLKLTELARKQNKAILPPEIVPADYLLASWINKNTVLSQIERKLLLIEVLKNTDLTKFDSLFPIPPANPRDIKYLSGISDLIIDLIRTLAENGFGIADFHKQYSDILFHDAGRWEDLATIEKAYIDKLDKIGLKDPDHTRIEESKDPLVPEKIKKIILIGVIDPVPVFFDVINKLSEHIDTEIWIYADEQRSQHFDSSGRPDVNSWTTNRIDIPDTPDDRSIYVESTPEQQGRRVIEIIKDISDNANSLTTDDISIFAINSCLAPYIKTSLANEDIETFDPSGIPLRNTELYSILACILDLTEKKDYSSFSALLRNADYIKYLKPLVTGFNVEKLLISLDSFQNTYKSGSLDDMLWKLDENNNSDYDLLREVLSNTLEIISQADKKPFCDYLTDIIRLIYKGRTIRNSENPLFIKSAEKINDLINELRNSRISLSGTIGDNIFLFNEYIMNQELYTEHSGGAVNIQGWLESMWSESKFAILAGMNEKYIPTAAKPSVFLPESIKEKAGLRNSRSNLARDAYMLTALVKSRANLKSVIPPVSMITGRWDTNGDPLKPSRLFFLCDDKTLVRRTGRFWGDEENSEEGYDASIHAIENEVSFKLKPIKNTFEGNLSASKIKVLLQSPLMFYLKHVLGMESKDDSSTEIDALEFGNICHKAFEGLSRAVSSAPDGKLLSLEAIRNCLLTSVDDYMRTMYGEDLPLAFLIAVDSMKSRLAKAAQIYLANLETGWTTIGFEQNISWEVNQDMIREWLKDDTIKISRPYKVTGRIDRIDRHKETGAIRIIDYKTGDKDENPEDSHVSGVKKDIYQDISYALFNFKGSDCRWTDLQLPLYCMILKEKTEFRDSAISCAYFNLPSSLDKISISAWPGDITGYFSAVRECLAKIILLIDSGDFSAPGKISRYDMDEFRRLFNDDPGKHIELDGQWMTGDSRQ